MVEKAQEAKAQERQPKDTESTGKGWAGPVHSGASRGDNRDNRHQLDVLGDYRHASSWWVTVACIKLVRDLLHQVDATCCIKLVRDYRHPLARSVQRVQPRQSPSQ